jgi:hypothetical protein
MSSLPKHKLTYAVSAVAPLAPPGMPITPLYLRVLRSARGPEFCLAECDWHVGQAVDELTVVKAERRQLLGLSLN